MAVAHRQLVAPEAWKRGFGFYGERLPESRCRREDSAGGTGEVSVEDVGADVGGSVMGVQQEIYRAGAFRFHAGAVDSGFHCRG